MKYRWTLLLLPFVTSAFAEEVSEMAITIMRDDGNSRIEFSSDDLDFDLFEMQVGENRSIVDSNGQSMLITRTADGFDLEAGGETIKIPDPGAVHAVNGQATDVDIDVMHEKVMIQGADEADAVIVTREAIDAETQGKIRELLGSAGVDGDVRFVDGIGEGAQVIKDVRVIRKETL